MNNKVYNGNLCVAEFMFRSDAILFAENYAQKEFRVEYERYIEEFKESLNSRFIGQKGYAEPEIQEKSMKSALTSFYDDNNKPIIYCEVEKEFSEVERVYVDWTGRLIF